MRMNINRRNLMKAAGAVTATAVASPSLASMGTAPSAAAKVGALMHRNAVSSVSGVGAAAMNRLARAAKAGGIDQFKITQKKQGDHWVWMEAEAASLFDNGLTYNTDRVLSKYAA